MATFAAWVNRDRGPPGRALSAIVGRGSSGSDRVLRGRRRRGGAGRGGAGGLELGGPASLSRRRGAGRRGKKTCMTVPAPDLLLMRSTPPWASTIRATMERPRPVPLGRVVKKGSSARARTSVSMPSPVSWIWISTPRTPSSSRLTSVTVSTPPPDMAWRALSMRLSVTCRTRLGSAQTGAVRSGSTSSCSSPILPSASAIPRSQISRRLTSWRSMAMGRAKRSRSPTRRFRRVVSSSRMRSRVSRSASATPLRRRVATALEMMARGFRTSWATTAESSPTAVSSSFFTSSSWAARSSS